MDRVVAVALTFLLLAMPPVRFNWIWSAIPRCATSGQTPRAAGPDHTIPFVRQRIQPSQMLRRFRKSPFGSSPRRVGLRSWLAVRWTCTAALYLTAPPLLRRLRRTFS